MRSTVRRPRRCQRQRHIGARAAARRNVHGGARAALDLAVEADAGRVGGILQREQQAPVFADEGVDAGHGTQVHADQIAMREMHRDHSETGEQEGEQQRDAVGVVEAGQQHDERQRRERQARARRQYVHAPRGDGDGQLIVALAAAGPGAPCDGAVLP